MNTTKPVIATSPSTPQTGFVVTLEGTNLLLTILLSTFALVGVGIKLVSKFNAITAELRGLREDLTAHAGVEGHPKLLEQTRILQKEVSGLDKKLDIHLQDYINYKDSVLLAICGCEEQIDHKWHRTEEEFLKDRAEIKDLKGFLVKNLNFKIRE